MISIGLGQRRANELAAIFNVTDKGLNTVVLATAAAVTAVAAAAAAVVGGVCRVQDTFDLFYCDAIYARTNRSNAGFHVCHAIANLVVPAAQQPSDCTALCPCQRGQMSSMSAQSVSRWLLPQQTTPQHLQLYMEWA